MLNATMTVNRPTDSTSAGTTTGTYNAHLSAVPCRWHRMSGTEAVRFGAERVNRMWRGSVDATVDILTRDQCIISNDTGTHTLYVLDTQDSSGAGIIRVIEAEEIT